MDRPGLADPVRGTFLLLTRTRERVGNGPRLRLKENFWKEVRPMADHYASGTWQVTEGRDQEFINRWTEFLQWSRANYPSIVVANLIRDRRVPGHYVSFAEWTDEASRDAWKQNPEFATHFDACVALCEHMSGADFDRVATV